MTSNSIKSYARQAIMTRLRTLVCSALLCFCAPSMAQDAAIIKNYGQGFSTDIALYLNDVLIATLDKSRNKFGPYHLQPYSKKLSANRAKIETEKGEKLDIIFSTRWSGLFVDPSKVHKVDLSVFNGLLGLRALITTPETSLAMRSIQNKRVLNEYVAGLGEKWGDVNILRSNKTPVTEVLWYKNNAFSMLIEQRYDYLPLSMLEARSTLKGLGELESALTIHDSLFIFYPLPVDIYINIEKKDLIARVQYGVEKMKSDGTLQSLFEKHFGYVFNDLDHKHKMLAIFKNPNLSQQENQKHHNAFLKIYGDRFTPLAD